MAGKKGVNPFAKKAGSAQPMPPMGPPSGPPGMKKGGKIKAGGKKKGK